MAKRKTSSGEGKSARKYLALLRAINVGGKNLLPMELLVRIFESAGCRSVRTYIQSGNVMFEASAALAGRLPAVITRTILDQTRLAVPVIIRTAEELATAVHSNPFADTDADPKTLHIAFLAEEPSAVQLATLDPGRSPPDKFLVRGREIYLHLPSGVARTRLTNAYFDSKLATVATVRSLGTVEKLLELCTCKAVKRPG